MEKLGSGDPQRIGRYRLLGRLGAGGMGQVFLARSDRGRTVAIKLVRPELAEQQQFRDRFRAEVQAARKVGGSWTAPVLDAGVDDAVPWVATGYVAGPSLHRIVSGRPGAPVAESGAYGPLPGRSVRLLGAGLAGALQDIHRAGLIHRDLKPSNVLVTIDGPRVIDFGIARALDTVADGGLTRTGAMIGSPGFMAPEQVRGERVTTACDVFCLGSVLAYAATGRLPFGAADSRIHALMYRIAQEEPDLTGVPADLVDVIRDCLEKDPAARPSTEAVLGRLGDTDTAEPWLPGALIAQLGRHAVELLDSEDPEEHGPEQSPPAPAPTPPHAPVRQPAATHPAPTRVAPPVPAPHPAPAPQQAYGYPGPQAPAYGYGYGYGPTPPHGPAATFAPPAHPRRRGAGSVLLLVAMALLVAAGAGWGVYALTQGAGGSTASSTGGSSEGGTTGGDTKHEGKNADGAVPSGLLGTWTAQVGGEGTSTRQLVVEQGGVGDRVLTLTAEGPLDTGGSYRCVFQADLESASSSEESVRVGASRITEGEPMTSCSPGKPTILTLLPDGGLRREIASSGESLTYRKSG
ncbi:serine/threonine protein kinase [Streptomyces sp. JH010]|uniref:serine/threonine-protein kinase n=1 Tax=Streptomyces sp. JH010 TaxID=2763535 RepID=UPI0023F718CB|nr:serine/threonine-protein kinase [Streptomyces sp. JH010]MDF6063367.1 serine/threonine protein kinase [Streptomyces sp. JH010]